MPKHKYKWWSYVVKAMSDPANPYVLAALEKAKGNIPEWDYKILTTCLRKKYIRREKRLEDIARDFGTSEKVVWAGIVRPFIFDVAAEIGFIEKLDNKKRKNSL